MKAVSLFIEDDIIIATIAGWDGKVTKMSREKFEHLPSEFQLLNNLHKEGGIYFLLGNGVGYVGQASITEKGDRNILKRVFEHKKENFWTEVIMLSSKGLGASDLNFLENSFYHLMKDSDALELYQTEPSLGHIPTATRISGELFIENIKIIFKGMGINFLTPSEHKIKNDVDLLQMTAKGVTAYGIMKDGKFFILKGSHVVLTSTASCSDSTQKNRTLHKDKISPDGEVLEDIPFSSPSGASSFVCFASVDGYTYWRYADGSTLKKTV